MKFVVAWRLGVLAIWLSFVALDKALGWDQPEWLHPHWPGGMSR